jgi:hypothetical protein
MVTKKGDERVPRLQAALLCDSAQEYAGKMSILGGFISILNVFSLPTFQPVMFVGRVSVEDEELNRTHEFEVNVVSPSGETTFTLRGSAIPSVNIVNENPELYVGLNVVLQLPLGVNTEGMHWVNFKTDDILMSSLPLLVKLNTAPL